MAINMSSRDLRAFLAVAETRSFSQAAQQMHLSQSALSTLIGRLETAVGARLFDRTTRTVDLSAAGEVLAAQKIALEMGPYLELYPHTHQTDGFFAAVLERRA